MTLEAGPRLRIVSPDTDGDPHTEPLVFASAAAIALVIDDAGVPASAAVADHLVAVRGGAPVSELRADLAVGPGGGATGEEEAAAVEVEVGAVVVALWRRSVEGQSRCASRPPTSPLA